MERCARATIHDAALRDNLALVKANKRRVLAVIKGNGYGHGLLRVAHNLNAADAFAITHMADALILRKAFPNMPIVHLHGADSADVAREAMDARIDLVVHDARHIAHLAQSVGCKSTAPLPALPITLWLKVDTGMHRLGLSPADVRRLWPVLATHNKVVLMSHLACADMAHHPANYAQLAKFKTLHDSLTPAPCAVSLSNSAAICRAIQDAQATERTDEHKAWFAPDSASPNTADIAVDIAGITNLLADEIARPGLMLYGVSPLAPNSIAADIGLNPAMCLDAPVIATRHLPAHEGLGYGLQGAAPYPRDIALLRIGYADGLRRTMQGTIRLNDTDCPIVGRVSMDITAIDVSRVRRTINLGDTAIIWGVGAPLEPLAAANPGSIPYEWLTALNQRVVRV